MQLRRSTVAPLRTTPVTRRRSHTTGSRSCRRQCLQAYNVLRHTTFPCSPLQGWAERAVFGKIRYMNYNVSGSPANKGSSLVHI